VTPAPPPATGAASGSTRNRHVDVMLAFGIVMVVMGHRHQPPWLFFPAYTFHMALFFFVSGYLATVKVGLREKARFLAHKTRTQLLLYSKWNAFFAVLTYLLALGGIRLGYAIPAFGSWAELLATLNGFFVVPFTDGHQYHLYAAAWFIPQLWLVHVLFQAVCLRPGRRFVLPVLVALVPVTLFLLEMGLQSYVDLRLTGVRTSFAFLFFLAGHTVRLEERWLSRLLLAPVTLLACFVLVNVIAVNFGNIRYNLVLGNVGNVRVWVPVVTTLLIVLIVFQLSHHAARFLGERSLVLLVGRSTQDILIWHFTVFFAVNVLFWALGFVAFGSLSDNWFAWEKERTWLIYELPALALPILARRWYTRLLAAPPEPARRREGKRGVGRR